MTRDRRTQWLLVAIYLTARVAWRLAGAELDGMPPGLWQLLPFDVLRDDLVRGLVALHSQPPLFNVLMAVAYKTPWPALVVDLELAAAGAAVVVILLSALRTLGVSRRIAAGATTVFMLNPAFTTYDHMVLYTIFEVALVAGAAHAMLTAGRQASEGRSRIGPFIAFALCGSGLVAIRPFYHPVFAVAIAFGAWLAFTWTRAALPRMARPLLWAPVLVAALIMAKNYWLVGEVATGTWAGMNMSRLVFYAPPPARWSELKQSGVLSPLADSHAFKPLADYASRRSAYAALVPAPAFDHPVLTSPVKDNGATNFNHVDYIAISRIRLRDCLTYIRDSPAEYARRVIINMASFTNPAAYDTPQVWYRTVLGYAVLWTTTEIGKWVFRVPVIAAILLVMIGSARRLWRAWHGDAAAMAQAPVTMFVMMTVAYTMAVSVLMEVGEIPRFRVPLDPLLWAASVSALTRLFGLNDRDRGVATELLEE